jgi:hypothetical protein
MIRFSAAQEWAETDLLRAYPAATSIAQAARMAAQEAVAWRLHHSPGRGPTTND